MAIISSGVTLTGGDGKITTAGIGDGVVTPDQRSRTYVSSSWESLIVYGADNTNDVGTYGYGTTTTKDFGIGRAAVKKARVYNTYVGSQRSCNVTVQSSPDNSNWTTRLTGVLDSGPGATGGLIEMTNAISTSDAISAGSHRYWHLVQGSAIIHHCPRVSRIDVETIYWL